MLPSSCGPLLGEAAEAAALSTSGTTDWTLLIGWEGRGHSH